MNNHIIRLAILDSEIKRLSDTINKLILERQTILREQGIYYEITQQKENNK